MFGFVTEEGSSAVGAFARENKETASKTFQMQLYTPQIHTDLLSGADRSANDAVNNSKARKHSDSVNQ
jgi:hypothetical protein